MTHWKSVDTVEGEFTTYVLQQKYVPPREGFSSHVLDEHRLISIHELVDEENNEMKQREAVDLSQLE
jgi:hypothetical protein